MKQLIFQLMIWVLLGQMAYGLYVPEGTVVKEDTFVIIDNYSNDNELKVAGTLDIARALVIGNNSYNARAEVNGAGRVESKSIYLGSGSRGCSLRVTDGGVVRTSAFNLRGDLTTGVAYGYLQNYVSVIGSGSRLEVAGLLDIWSPKGFGQAGSPFSMPREIPAYLDVSDGGEVVVDSLSVENGSWLSVRSGGKLTIQSDFDASSGHVYQMKDGILSVGGELSGLSLVNAGCRVEAASVLGDLNIEGVFAAATTKGSVSVEGDLVISEQGMLELSSHAKMTISGATTLGGMLRIDIDEGQTFSFGDELQLFDFQNGVSGSFDSIEFFSNTGSLEWDFSELSLTGAVSVIPEPATLSMIILGGLLLVFRRSR